MLVLTRHFGQSIVINDNITVTLLSQKGDQFKIGIEAPIEIEVDRKELHERKRARKNALAESAAERAGSAVRRVAFGG